MALHCVLKLWRRLPAFFTLFLILAGLNQPLPAQSNIPTPESVLGHKPGDDFYLANYDESLDYFKKLAAASDKIQLQQVGKTSKGLDWYIAIISSPENLAQLDKYKEIARKLAWARDLTDEQAHQLAREGKAIVHIDGGLHSTEVAHAQHTIQLAYNLVSAANDPQIARILHEVILVLWFSINPDGQNMVVSWYRRNLGTPFEVSPLPYLYQKYVGHDNNRDGYMNNMHESRVVTRTVLDFSPQVFYNHHQSAPFPTRIWIPPFAEPVSSNVHPLMWRWVNVFGTSMAAYLDEHHMPGAVHRGRGFDDWYPGFIDHVNSFRNTISFLTETALYRYATPHFYTVNDFPRNRQDLRAQVLYASPWKGGWWHLGDAVRYMLGASMSVLDTAARYRESLLYNRYQAGRDVIRHFTRNPPYAFVIPARQHDPQTAALLARKMRINGLEVRQARQPFEANGRTYSAGSWVILMNQPFAALAKELFERQHYPDLRDFPNGPPDLPYDVAGWTLPPQMGVEAVPVLTDLPDSVRSTFQNLDQVQTPPGAVSGSGRGFIFSHQPNFNFKMVNDILAAGGSVSLQAPASKAEQDGDQGNFVATGIDRSRIEEMAVKYGIQVQAGTAGSGTGLKAPRLGLYRPWAASIDEGWTRWLLENYHFSLSSLRNADIEAGHLGDRLDVIIIPDVSTRTIMQGYKEGLVPDEFAGGIGEAGLSHLVEFVKEGGTLLTFNRASLFAIDRFNLPVRNVVDGLKNQEFFCSGSILRVTLPDPSHPVVLGMPAQPAVMFARSPAFEPKPGFKGTILAAYPTADNPLLSGYILHPKHIEGKAALMDVDFGRGHIILFGFRPQWRGQSQGTYKFIFNSLFYFGDLAGKTAPREESKQNADLQIWQNIRSGIHTDLGKLVAQNKTYNRSRGAQALQQGRQLDGMIEGFEKEHLAALSELKGGLAGSPAAPLLSGYLSKLKSVLLDLRARDLGAVNYTTQDLFQEYGLASLEARIHAEVEKSTR